MKTENNSHATRVVLIDFLKGILIFFVCVGHAIQFLIYRNSNFWEDFLYKLIYLFHMPLFMATAGYVAYESISRSTSRINFLKKRFIQFFTVAISWAILHNILLTSRDFNLLIFLHRILSEASSQLWFLWALLGSVVVLIISLTYKKSSEFSTLILFGAVLFLPDYGVIPLFKFTLPFFLIGYFSSKLKIYLLISNINLNVLMILLLGFYIFFVVTWRKDYYIYISGMSFKNYGGVIFYRWIVGGIVSFFWIIVAVKFINRIPLFLFEIIVFCGKKSFSIYVIQTYVYIFLGVVFSEYSFLFAGGLLGSFLAIVFGFLVIGFSLLVDGIISKNNFLSFMFLGR